MKKVLSLVFIAITMVILQGCSSSNVYTFVIDESYKEYITLGTSADYPPYEWPMNVDGKNTLVGIDIEIAKEIAKAAKKNLRVINRSFDFLLTDLENGKVDFVLAGLTPNEERSKQVDFSNIYYEAIQVVLIKKDNLETFTSIEVIDNEKNKVGAQLGSIQKDLVEENFKNAQNVFIQSIPDIVMQLMDNKLHAVVMEKPVADGYVNKQPSLAIANITIGDPDGGSAVAVQKGNAELLALINTVIDELIASGKINQFVEEAVNLNS